MRLIDKIYFLFLLTLSIDPTGFHSRLKDILFIVLVVYGLIYCLKHQQYIASINRITFVAFLLIPLWGMFIAYITNNLTNVPFAVGQLRSMSYIFIFFFVVTMRLDVLLKIVWINGIILAVLTLVLFFLSELGGVFLAAIYDYCNASRNYMMAHNRNFIGFSVNGLYYVTGSLIIFSFIYNLYQYRGPFRFVLSVILYLSLMVAGSRTPMLVQTFILFIYLYDKNVIGKFLTRISTIVLLGLLVMVTYLLATQENANDIKYENYESYVEEMSNKGHLIWGAGLGSEFYAKGIGTKLAYSELSYMDVFRMYGIPAGGLLVFLFFVPCFWLWKYFSLSLFLNRYCLGYALFLILSGTNPLLLGSVGLTALTLFMTIVNKVSWNGMQKGQEIGAKKSGQIDDEKSLIIDNILLR